MASAIVHATAFAVAPGHGREIGLESVDPTIEVIADVPAPAATPTVTEPPEPDARARSHTHPYPVPPSHDWAPHDPALVHLPALAAAPETAAATSVLTAPPSDPVPRFAIVVGAAPHASGDAVAAHERGEAPGDADPIAAERATTPARLLTFASPAYPAEARAQGIEARVVLEIVVDTAGRVKSTRVARSAGPGFDDAALVAIRSYRFAPAKLDGRAVSVRMPWSVEFQLQ